MRLSLGMAAAIAAALPISVAAADSAPPWPFDDLEAGPTLRITRCDEARVVGELVARDAQSLSLRVDGGPVRIALSEACGIERRRSFAGRGFVVGTVVGIAGAAGLSWLAARDGENDDSLAPVMIGMIVGGMGGGALVGAAMPRWERVDGP